MKITTWIALTCLVTPLVPFTCVQAQTAALPADVNAQTLTRLPQLTREDLSPEGQAVYDEIVGDGPVPTTGPVSASLYSPKLAVLWNELNQYLRNDSVVGRKYFEIAATIAAAEIGQHYEYASHEPAALQFGISQAAIETIRYNREPVGLPADEDLIIRLFRQIMRDHRVEPALFADAVAMFGRQGVVELITIMGDYIMVGMVLTAIDQQVPEGRVSMLPATK